jgi:hypothetical protein
MQPRTQFEGTLKINFITGREIEIEAETPLVRLAKRATAWSFILLVCTLTVLGALMAETVATYTQDWWEQYDENDDGVLQFSELVALVAKV